MPKYNFFFTSSQNATFWSKVGEMGVGETGVGGQVPIPSDIRLLSWTSKKLASNFIAYSCSWLHPQIHFTSLYLTSLFIYTRPSQFFSFRVHRIKVPSFPGLPRFCSAVCVQYNTRKWKNSKKWGRPGNTYHVNDVWWMRGGRRGEGPTFK